MAEPQLSEDLRRYLDSVPPFTEADLKALEKAARDLDNDPEFLADVARMKEEEQQLEQQERDGNK